MKKALLYKKLKENIVQCQACNHYCKISEDAKGICGIRKNKGGALYATDYGLTSGVQIDQIEKKPFFHFFPTKQVLSIGTVGCNFACDFCQNAWMSQSTKDNNVDMPNLYKLPPSKIVELCKENDLEIIAYTYNEPAISFEYSYETSKFASSEGIKNVYVSNGYASKEAIDMIASYLDAINIDLKSFSEDFYIKRCKAKLKPVLENIEYYYKKNIWVEVTTLIIPGENDSTEELNHIGQFISSVSKSIPWHVIRFTPSYKMSNTEKTPEKKIQEAYDIGKSAGLEYVYAGNVFDEDRHSTFCPKCNNLIIKRDWGYAKIEGLENGKCSKCSTKIAGVWQ